MAFVSGKGSQSRRLGGAERNHGGRLRNFVESLPRLELSRASPHPGYATNSLPALFPHLAPRRNRHVDALLVEARNHIETASFGFVALCLP